MLDQAAPPDGDSPADESRATRVPLGLVAGFAGAMVGLGVVAALVMTGFFTGDQTQPNADGELIAAYERGRNSVFAIDGEFSRTMPDGRRLESGALVVQAPPNELRRQLGGTSGRMNGRQVNCSTGPEGRFQCANGAEVGPWDEMVSREVENLRSYFDPNRPVYAADRIADGCYELTLVGVVAEPPYGVRAVMCFDGPTGAMRSIEVEHAGGAIDRLEASAIRTTVTDQDLSLGGDDAFAARPEGGDQEDTEGD